MSEKKYKVGYFEDPVNIDDYVETIDGEYLDASDVVRLLNKLSDENKQLKQSNQEAIGLICDGIVEMHDGKRDYAEKLLNEAIELIKIRDEQND